MCKKKGAYPFSGRRSQPRKEGTPDDLTQPSAKTLSKGKCTRIKKAMPRMKASARPYVARIEDPILIPNLFIL